MERASPPKVSSYWVIQARTLAPFAGVGYSLEASSFKRGKCGLGYWSRSIKSSSSMPPSVGIPLNLLVPTLDTPSKFSRQASFSTPRWVSLTLVLEGDRRTHPAGQSTLPRDSYGSARPSYLAMEGRVVAVCFLARWTRLFTRELLWHCVTCGICNVLSGGEKRPLGGAFNWDVTTFVGSARWGGSPIKITGSPGCLPFRIPPLLSPLLPIAVFSCLLEAQCTLERTKPVEPPFLLPLGCL